MTDERAIRSAPWPPIPAHAVEIGGRPMLPERLTEIDGKPYVRCDLHGLIPADHRCEDSPEDHHCGTQAHPNFDFDGAGHDDQASSHRDWADNLLDRINAIRDLHVKDDSEGGMTSGGCKECGLGWPCPTAHFANGWGEMHACWDAGWCEHVGEKVDAAEAGYIEPPITPITEGGS